MRISNAVSSGDIVAQRRGVTLSGHATTRPDHETTEVVAWENPRLRGHLILQTSFARGGPYKKKSTKKAGKMEETPDKKYLYAPRSER